MAENIGPIILLVFIATSLWVFFDARSIGVRKGQLSGLANRGPVGWLFSCLFLWILAFPMYLAKRSDFKAMGRNASSPSASPPPETGTPMPQRSQPTVGIPATKGGNWLTLALLAIYIALWWELWSMSPH
jgi:hypothetical protein